MGQWMNLLSFFRRKRRQLERERRLEALKGMGYGLVANGRLSSGKVLLVGYILVAPTGEVLDNEGMGYANTSAAYSAALNHRPKT
jgi:hypothetical protein